MCLLQLAVTLLCHQQTARCHAGQVLLPTDQLSAELTSGRVHPWSTLVLRPPSATPNCRRTVSVENSEDLRLIYATRSVRDAGPRLNERANVGVSDENRNRNLEHLYELRYGFRRAVSTATTTALFNSAASDVTVTSVRHFASDSLDHAVDLSSLSKFKRSLNRVDFSVRFYGMRSRSCCYIECVCFFPFLRVKCKRQFSVPFLSCSCSRVDHVCVFLFS